MYLGLSNGKAVKLIKGGLCKKGFQPPKGKRTSKFFLAFCIYANNIPYLSTGYIV